MTTEQMELFSEYMAKKPVPPAQHTEPTQQPTHPTQQPQAASGSVIVVIDGKEYAVTDKDIDNLEKMYGEWKNDAGVSFWWLLRRLKNDGAKKINLI